MSNVSLGLRERKKRRTRATLVDAAAELCLARGYDNTTVEQIAAAADVSPRTFSRYFPTKVSVVAAITDELDALIAEAMDRLPDGLTAYDALLAASLEELMSVEGVGEQRARAIREGLSRLAESSILERYV